jgi:hypothetical protein
MFERPLKAVSTEDLERVIAEAVTKLVGKEYKAEISLMDFNHTNASFGVDEVRFQLKLSQPLNFEKVESQRN